MYSENKGSVGGCGFAKNRCVEQSHGRFLCFQDADDVMYPDRIKKQVEVLASHPKALVGTRFEWVSVEEVMSRRKPANSMRHYSEWMNNLVDEDLLKYQYREVLVIQPTWMMTRETFDRVGGYVERGEDNTPYPEVGVTGWNDKRIWTSIIVI